MIENMTKELEELRALLAASGPRGDSFSSTKATLRDNEFLLGEMLQTFDHRIARAQRLDRARRVFLQDMSLHDDDLRNALSTDTMVPYMVNMADDPSVAGCLLYYVLPGKTTSIGAALGNTVRLSGIGIADQLCVVENEGNTLLTISKCGSEGRVVVDGQRLAEGLPLQMR